ncbi:sodium:solute symporter family protein [Leptospira sp. GIMC2001]|uniref:sodium:solute symporter family protein n=1 Tax=Leptospira sp. GIMC2001 TaxID=1513297 RepID=UPI00234A9386|nr:sodium:solute symporter family protein [Leptospira sp. GIMC2001]WCL50839.1 sodium:solute symporter family protein [Leptospira sp. GIMC2001]
MIESSILSWQSGMLLIAGFSVTWIALGWYWGRNNKSSDDFQLAGRNVGFALATATSMATWVTTNTTLVAPELTYEMGIWGMVGYSMGAVGLILFAPLARKIKKILPNAYTSGDFFRIRYGNASWRLFLVISLIYSIGWLVSLGMAGGILLQSLTSIPYEIGLTVILFVCVSYTLLGGLKAVIGTDFLQTVLILIGLVIMGTLAWQKVGTMEIRETIIAERPELLNILFPAALIFLFNNILFGIGEIFHSNVWWTRAFAFRDGIGFRAFLWSGILWIPVPITAGFIAFLAPVYNINVPYPDMVGPLVAGQILGKTGAIIVFVLVFSALASSLDSLLAATSDLISEDIYKRHINPQALDAQMQNVSKISILLLGFIAWIICLPRISNLAAVLHFSGALVASTIWPVLLGLYWDRANRNFIFFAMLVGSISGLTAYFYIGFYTAALVGTAVSMVISISSGIIKPEKFNWDKIKG